MAVSRQRATNYNRERVFSVRSVKQQLRSTEQQYFLLPVSNLLNEKYLRLL
jgi:hypothetical protein